ncbi:MAG: hypothetical protein HYW48_09480, partial [Deltaproteobacteria bacterium]|nr:hypothetical protein [Deltaproteobacteria bacterium]
MKTVSFTHPLTRRISHADIESLPLAATTIKVLKTLFDHYDQDSLDGLSISQAKLASELGLSTTTIARALRQAAESGFLMIFDTYIKGVGQAASRYFFPQSLIVREYAEQIIALPGRASQLRGKSFEDIKPTLIVDKESGKVVDQYFPTEQKPWPVFESQEFAKVRNNNPTVDELIKKLKMAQ